MSELLEKAIADARAIRATAYSNAKAMLEEAFAPRLERMLSSKLQQEVGGDDEEGEIPAVTDVTPAQPAPAVSVDVPAPEQTNSEVPPVSAPTVAPATSVAPAVATPAPTDSAIVPAAPADDEAISPEVNAPADGQQSAIPVEQPQGGQVAGGEVSDENDTAEITDGEIDEILKELGLTDAEKEADATTGGNPANTDEEEIDLQELLGEESKENEISDKEIDDIIGRISETKDKHSECDDDEDDKEKIKALTEETLSLKKSLGEHENTVKYLRERINEVNVLNSKLFHMNKLFKEHSLSNEQKNRVVEAFDLTQSVRETKLVYTTLTETFNSGKKTVEARRIAPTAIKTLTEGLASKAIASTKPAKEVLAENTDKLRFQKLAGIKLTK